MELIVFLVSLLGFMALGIPIAFVLGLVGIAMMLHSGVVDMTLLAQRIIDGSNNYSLMAIPFFILAGELMNYSGITERIINFVMSMVGHIRGGLGYAVIIAAIIFAGLSGSAIADTVALGTVLIPMMSKRGYKKNQVTGLVVSSGIIGPVIPPSTGFIIFGVVSGTSIIKLFMAGIIPGVLLGLSLAIVWAIISRKDKQDLPERKSFKEIVSLGLQSFWGLILPVIIIGGLRLGFFTPTEAGIIAVFYILFIGLFVYKDLKFKGIYMILASTATTTGIVMFPLGFAEISSWYITTSNISEQIVSFLAPLISTPTLLMLTIVIFLLLVGMVMDTTPATLILVPIMMPVIEQAGIDPIYFGVIFMLTLTIGLLTPPYGISLFAGMSIANISLEELLKGAWPFILAEAAVLFLLVLFPEILTVPLKLLM